LIRSLLVIKRFSPLISRWTHWYQRRL